MRAKSNAVAAPFILPACCVCHLVAGDEPQSELGWTSLQTYLDRHHLTHADIRLSHTYCPSCYSVQAQAWHIPQPAMPSQFHSRRPRSHR